MPRMPKFPSPYGPRPRRSAQLVIIWMVILVIALIVTFYLTSRERDAPASYAEMRLPDDKEPAGGGVKMAKIVP
ncbi:hypothetical protein F5B19DRAFT_441684 [Rostrohypoxylon terebratum]|nr:hypothetical protein F5B19DRAFT_441684 [Rostrohypoxylon terebratum]